MHVLKDARGFLRRRPDFALPGGKPSLSTVLTVVKGDIVEFDRCEISVQCEGQYCAIEATQDWMDVPNLSVEELFSRIVPRPSTPSRINYRSEVVIGAFAMGFATRGDAGDHCENLQESEVPKALHRRNTAGRYLVFKV
jgi:hypothetical protein